MTDKLTFLMILLILNTDITPKKKKKFEFSFV